MNDHDKAVRQFCLEALEPIVQTLLKNGVTYKEFAELSKKAFILVAQQNYGIRGRSANTAKVSALTGIDRKQIKRISDELKLGDTDDSQQSQPLDRITRILSAWYEEYSDDVGCPINLPLKSDQPDQPSVLSLIKRFAGDIPATTLLKEIQNSGCIEELKNNHWRVLRRQYINVKTDADSVIRSGRVIQDLGRTIIYNLYESGEELEGKRFERRTTVERIHKKHLPEFNELLKDEGQKFLDNLDAWMIAREAPATETNKNFIRLGVGMYLIFASHNQEKM